MGVGRQMHSFVVYYIESNMICVIVFGILLFFNHFNIDRQEKQIKYDHALVAFILYFLADSVWAELVGGTILKTRTAFVLDVFLIYLFMAAITYTWLDYVMAVEQVPHRGRPINRFAVIFPFLVATAALIVNYIVAPETLISEELDTLPLFSVYLVTVPSIYLVAILFYSIRKARTEENPNDRYRDIFIGLFPQVTLIGGMIQMLFLPYVPIYCFVCMILMLVFYIQSIERQVSLDPLTSLNNRGQLMRYVSQRSNLFQEGRLTVVVMIDVNDFKGINDSFGHAEGDRALVIVADSLRKVVNRRGIPSFLGRYGGDEFILILHPTDREETGLLLNELSAEIEQCCGDLELPYILTVSAGYEELAGEQDSFQSCILRADQKLYESKAHKHERSALAV